MNASQIIFEDMTLEEKLKAIDEAIAAAQNKAKIDVRGLPVTSLILLIIIICVRFIFAVV